MGQHPQNPGSGSRGTTDALMPSTGFPRLAGLADPQQRGRAAWQERGRRYRPGIAQVSPEPLLVARAALHCPPSPQPAWAAAPGPLCLPAPHRPRPSPRASASSSPRSFSSLWCSDKEPLSCSFNSSAHCLAMPPWSLCCIFYKKINWMPEVAALVGISAPEAYLKCLPSSASAPNMPETQLLFFA